MVGTGSEHRGVGRGQLVARIVRCRRCAETRRGPGGGATASARPESLFSYRRQRADGGGQCGRRGRRDWRRKGQVHPEPAHPRQCRLTGFGALPLRKLGCHRAAQVRELRRHHSRQRRFSSRPGLVPGEWWRRRNPRGGLAQQPLRRHRRQPRRCGHPHRQ